MQKFNEMTDNSIQEERLLEEVDRADRIFLIISGVFFFACILLMVILLCIVCSLKDYLFIIMSRMY